MVTAKKLKFMSVKSKTLKLQKLGLRLKEVVNNTVLGIFLNNC